VDIASGQERSILDVTKDEEIHPGVAPIDRLAFSGNNVVWRQFPAEGLAKVFVQDVPSGKTQSIADGDLAFAGLAVDGDKVVLTDNDTVTLIDLQSGNSQALPTGDSLAIRTTPLISGPNIVWLENEGDLAHHDLRTGKTRTVRQNLLKLQGFALSGSRLVWSDARNAKDDVYLYDLDADHETTITAGFEQPGSPVISGDLIAWLASVGGPTNVAVFEAPG
jgi:hypothetical protein